jgi:hypothetical protein
LEVISLSDIFFDWTSGIALLTKLPAIRENH